jgi:O-antigen/teichoic acid export membrane protein
MTDDPQSKQAESGGGSEPSLTSRVVKSVGWVFAGRVANRGLGLIKMVVLARLLAPENFGLFGIVMLAIATLQTFITTGFNTALIQKQENTEEYLDTAWTIQVVRGLVLAGILFAAAPAVGWFFEEPRAVPLLRVMCISVALGGFINIGMIYFQKELEFHKSFIYESVSAFLSLAVGIALAYHLRSVWALIWAGLAGAIVNVVLSYVFHPYRPTFSFDRSKTRELFRFGKWILGSSVVVFLSTQGDDAFLGKILGAGALGLYQMAYRLSNLPATQITHVTNAVMMPAYAKVQDNPQRLGRAFLQVFEIVITLVLPLTALLVFAAPEIVLGLLGEQWADAIVPLQILTFAGLLRAIAATGGPLFVGSGMPHMDFWMNVCRVGMIAVFIYPLTMRFGVAGTSFCIVLALASTLPLWARVLRYTQLDWSAAIRRCLHGFVLALLVMISVLITRSVLGEFLNSYALLLVAQVFVSGLACAVWFVISWTGFRTGPTRILLRSWKALRAP